MKHTFTDEILHSRPRGAVDRPDEFAALVMMATQLGVGHTTAEHIILNVLHECAVPGKLRNAVHMASMVIPTKRPGSQLELGVARTAWESGSSTSLKAAHQKVPTAKTDERKVFDYLIRSGGATDDEIEEALDMRHQNASARRRSLVLKGFVMASGAERKTRSGRSAQVWRVVEHQ